MEDILIPKERHDAVVLIGVDRGENVEFIKVYAVSEEKAKQTLEEFFSAKGLFPGDYRLVSRGSEEVGERKAITTKSEASLSASLARLGLRLLSNGVLYLEGVERIYQFTLVSEALYQRITFEKGEDVKEEPVPEFEPLDVFSLGVDVLVENLRGTELGEVLPPDTVLLREPPLKEVYELLEKERDFPIVVETKDAGKYSSLDFPAIVRLPPLTVEEFAAELSERLGFRVEPERFLDYPPERLNLRNVDALARLVRALMARKRLSPEEALSLAVRLNLGGP
ncbi:hypothetical protein [Thermococcus radiotolerans]|uniref:Uncharacterized protein n=1 Tax=Thermococcus radiotolerans TaxID=187880 RepID=A0A2Z2MXS2_9EURY|nr:hypothetical protein [Thermococcus radiotolerans]ASJ14648.1 hypothetical protein A3L10_05690 [Thermococcus radiotolerans]